MLAETRSVLDRAEAGRLRAREAVANGRRGAGRGGRGVRGRRRGAGGRWPRARHRGRAGSRRAARAETQGREAEARAARSSAEGEANALRAEVAALARLVEREAQAGHQLLDRLEVEPGFEKALGAALADDLRAPEVAAARSGWAVLPGYDDPQPLPPGAEPLAARVKAPAVLARRLSQIGLVSRARQGARLQAALRPGQRLVSLEGDLWRWDGFRAGAEDAPSAAALRLQQLNRLVQLKRDLEEVAARADGARRRMRPCRRGWPICHAPTSAPARPGARPMPAGRGEPALSRAEADRSIAGGKLEAAKLAVSRFEDEAMAARARLKEAEAAVADLPDLDAARGAVEAAKITVEAARITMMTRRSHQDEVRREGEARSGGGRRR
jgi:chromosome segregation protein